MASKYRRRWTGPDGRPRTAWVVQWVEADGKRRQRQFPTRREATAYHQQLELEITTGTAPTAARTLTLREAALQFAEHQERRAARGEIERRSAARNTSHVMVHLVPDPAGDRLLADLRPADFAQLRDRLLAARGFATAREVMVTVRAVCRWAHAMGAVGANHAAEVRVVAPRAERQQPRAIPDRAQLRRLAQAVTARCAALEVELVDAFAVLGLFTGLRASELRGLGVADLVLDDTPRVRVARRADDQGELGPCKSTASYRTVPLAAVAVPVLRRWLLRCGPTRPDIAAAHGRLLFPSEAGTVISHQNLAQRHWRRLMAAAELVRPAPLNRGGQAVLGRDGQPRLRQVPLFGFHDLRHAAASLWIESGLDGKAVQQLLGHADIQLTYNTYGHLFRDRWAEVNPGDLIARQLGLA